MAAASAAINGGGGGANANNLGGGTFNNPYQQRPRRLTELLASQQSSGSNPSSRSSGIQHGDSLTSNAGVSLQRMGRSQASLTAQSRRSLFFLFLIAVYTTFGLTVHNLPVTPELEFTGVQFFEPAATTVSADVLPETMEDLSKAQLRVASNTEGGVSPPTGNKHGGIRNHMAFARRTTKQKVLFRPKEIKDFYQQQALAEHVDYSFFINCGVLVAVALWAWRERRNSSDSSLRDGGEETDAVLV